MNAVRVVIAEAAAEDVWLAVPGRWRRLQTANGRASASVSCPACGRTSTLTHHRIGAGGEVTPSVICGYADCDFHDRLVLDGWRP